MGGKSSKEASTANARLPEDESAPISESAVVLEENLQSKLSRETLHLRELNSSSLLMILLRF